MVRYNFHVVREEDIPEEVAGLYQEFCEKEEDQETEQVGFEWDAVRKSRYGYYPDLPRERFYQIAPNMWRSPDMVMQDLLLHEGKYWFFSDDTGYGYFLSLEDANAASVDEEFVWEENDNLPA